MGGAVRAVTKPVEQVAKAVARPVVDVVSVATGGKTSGQKQAEAQTQAVQAQAAQAAQATQAKEAAKPAERRASASEELMGSRLRGARRRGRQLLSDARLNPEEGMQTLGGGQNLG